MKSGIRLLVLIAMVVIVAMAIVFNWINVDEAYGSGPPYYARTTNMDKWVDPRPVLFAVDALAMLVVGALAYLLSRRKGRNETPGNNVASR
jgi:hypothetical protein